MEGRRSSQGGGKRGGESGHGGGSGGGGEGEVEVEEEGELHFEECDGVVDVVSCLCKGLVSCVCSRAD